MVHYPIQMREARQNAGLSQQGLADRLGVHQPTVAQWESGRVLPRVDTALRLAAALGTSVEALWAPDESPANVGRSKRGRAVAAAGPVTATEVPDAIDGPYPDRREKR